MRESVLIDAKSDADGIWRDSGGEALHVSASDLERHAYCPLSWHLARSGVRGDGEAVKQGALAHAEIHVQMASYEKARKGVIRELTVWSWWFGIIVALAIDAATWYLIADKMPPRDVARYLAALATVWVGVMLVSTILPWRNWLNWPTAEEAAIQKDGMSTEEIKTHRELFPLDDMQFTELVQFLNEADLIKYAREIPSPQKVLLDKERINNLIQQL